MTAQPTEPSVKNTDSRNLGPLGSESCFNRLVSFKDSWLFFRIFTSRLGGFLDKTANVVHSRLPIEVLLKCHGSHRVRPVLFSFHFAGRDGPGNPSVSGIILPVSTFSPVFPGPCWYPAHHATLGSCFQPVIRASYQTNQHFSSRKASRP